MAYYGDQQRGGNTYDYGYQSKVTSYIEPQRRVAQSHYGGAATGRKPAANGCGWPALIGGLIAVVGIIGGSVAFFTLGLDGSNAVGQSSPPTLKPTPLPTTLRSVARYVYTYTPIYTHIDTYTVYVSYMYIYVCMYVLCNIWMYLNMYICIMYVCMYVCGSCWEAWSVVYGLCGKFWC